VLHYGGRKQFKKEFIGSEMGCLNRLNTEKIIVGSLDQVWQ
jgi:hypothetical protein